MQDETIRKAIKLRDHLRTLVFARDQISKDICRDAAEMLEKLGTEVTRLREAIGHRYYGTISDRELREIAETWNTPRDGGAFVADHRQPETKP